MDPTARVAFLRLRRRFTARHEVRRMEMTPDYMAETVAFLERAGLTHEVETDVKERDGVPVFRRTRYHLRRVPDEYLVLEAIAYPDGPATFYLEFVRFHGLTSMSFQLDSWKYFSNRVEFKYYAHPESGMGLSFVLELPST